MFTWDNGRENGTRFFLVQFKCILWINLNEIKRKNLHTENTTVYFRQIMKWRTNNIHERCDVKLILFSFWSGDIRRIIYIQSVQIYWPCNDFRALRKSLTILYSWNKVQQKIFLCVAKWAYPYRRLFNLFSFAIPLPHFHVMHPCILPMCINRFGEQRSISDGESSQALFLSMVCV